MYSHVQMLSSVGLQSALVETAEDQSLTCFRIRSDAEISLDCSIERLENVSILSHKSSLLDLQKIKHPL